MLCLEENSQPLEQFWKKGKLPMNWKKKKSSGNDLPILVNHIVFTSMSIIWGLWQHRDNEALKVQPEDTLEIGQC